MSPSEPLSTVALHGGRLRSTRAGALVPGIVQSTTFLKQAFDMEPQHAYSRVSNPTVSELERRLGALERAAAVRFASGLAAETALFLATLRAGDHAVCGAAVYGGTVRLFRQVLADLGVSVSFAESGDPAAVAGALTPATRLVFVETPANPALALTDIASVANAAHQGGAILAVDNTFLTPVLQQPLELGADVALYSTTKLIEGHSVALGGAVVTRDSQLAERLRFLRKCTGGIIAPFNAWLTIQGLKTLTVRLDAQSRHAATIARWLAEHPLVSRVHYPGLSDFPQRDLAQRQHRGAHGNVVSFELAGGLAAGAALCEHVRLCALAEHVGSVETLLTHPATMTHADVPPLQRRATGVTDGLLRLSVGLEDTADVIADLEQAIAAAHQTTSADAEGRQPCLPTR